MSEGTSNIIIAICGCIGSLIGSFSGLRLITYRIDQLEKKVDKHNKFATRLPVVEEQIKVINHRIDDLERTETHE